MMTHTLKPYPAYKDPGAPWLGKIPAHWETHTLKHIASVRLSGVDKHSIEGEIPVRLCNYTDVYYKKLITSDLEFMRATATQAEIAGFTLRGGDVLITKDSETPDDIAVPALVTQDLEDVLCGYHLAVIRPDQESLSGKYLLYAFLAPALSWQFEVSANGITRYGLSKHAIKNASFLLPPLEEQRAIARFLTHYDRLIRRYIRAQQRLIELLQEQKQALIQQAVTRGLDPDVPLKESGIDWLGEIPLHWETAKIKHLALLKSGDSITSLDIEDSGQYPVFGGNGIRGFTSSFTHEGHFVLIGRQGALCGNINYAKGKFWASEHAVVADPLRKFNTLWFGELLRSMNLNQYSISAAQPGLSVERIANLKIPLPDPSEQNCIARYIEKEITTLDRSIAHSQRRIDLIREYRTRLIADVVTGKLDVRDVALPAAAPESQEEDDE